MTSILYTNICNKIASVSAKAQLNERLQQPLDLLTSYIGYADITHAQYINSRSFIADTYIHLA